MRSSFAKGRALELEVVNKLRDAGIECEHIGGPGDMEIDIKGVACSIPSSGGVRIGGGSPEAGKGDDWHLGWPIERSWLRA
ncbi:353_t:CDS:2 [Entrophospora sp. SA101]|nr:353_t:CDS:2 [Entrophospora sp. SA101]